MERLSLSVRAKHSHVRAHTLTKHTAEGIMALQDPKLRALYDLKVLIGPFVPVPMPTSFFRSLSSAIQI